MGVLDQVLAYKRQKDAEATADISAVPQALMAFQQGQQQRTDNVLKALTLQASIAPKGLRIQEDNGKFSLQPDQSLMNQIGKTTGVYSFNPDTGALEQVATVAKGSTVRNMVTPEQRAERVTATKEAEAATTPDTLERASKLRQEVISNPVVKDYQEITSRVKTLDSLLSQSNKDPKALGTLDQALITTFNKITDPNSVVRESEYARTPEGASIINRFEGNITKLQKGGAGMTPQTRAQLVQDAKAIANGVGEKYNEIIGGYEDLAGKYKVGSDLVLGSYKKHEPFKLENSGGKTSSGNSFKKVG